MSLNSRIRVCKAKSRLDSLEGEKAKLRDSMLAAIEKPDDPDWVVVKCSFLERTLKFVMTYGMDSNPNKYQYSVDLPQSDTEQVADEYQGILDDLKLVYKDKFRNISLSLNVKFAVLEDDGSSRGPYSYSVSATAN